MTSLEFRLLKIQNFLVCDLNSNKTTLLTSKEHSGAKCFGTCVKTPPETMHYLAARADFADIC